MNTDDLTNWNRVRTLLTENIPGWSQSDPSEPLTLPLEDEDWLLEITPQGLVVLQAGYDLEDMKSLLSDGTPEDLGSDELAKQAKFYLQQTVSKYRTSLTQLGFVERAEMNDEYVAVLFEKPMDLDQMKELENMVLACRKQFVPF